MHIISDIKTKNQAILTDMKSCSVMLEKTVKQAGAQNLGITEYSFPDTNGFTMVMCLAESHIALHTWPELNCLTLDVYLCNYANDNTAKGEAIFQSILNHFEPDLENTTRLMR
jgi:S-adenosylmethionine decarboxylase